MGEQKDGITGATPVPCRHCEDRHPACHDTCDRYQEYKRKRDEINAKRKEQQDLVSRVWAVTTNKLIREKKGK